MLVQTRWFSNQDRFFEGLQPTSTEKRKCNNYFIILFIKYTLSLIFESLDVLLDNEIPAPERESDKKLSETFFTSLLNGHAAENAKPAAR